MPFPADYKRVQQAGGVTADVAAHVPLIRQLLVDTTKKKLYVGDGATVGGLGILSDSEFPTFFQAAPVGTQAFVENGTDGAGDLNRTWKTTTLKALFDKVLDTSVPASWLVKDSAMPDTMRDYAKQISNLNLAIETGHYRCDPSATTNLPGTVSTGTTVQLFMLVMMQSANEGIQWLFIRDGTGRRWTRNYTGGAFGAWVQETGLTSVDIAGKLDLAGGTMTGNLNMNGQQIQNGVILAGAANTFADQTTSTKRAKLDLSGITIGQIRTLKLPDRDVDLGNLLGLATPVATTSGAVVDFTIPSWANRITLTLSSVSTNGTSVLALRLGSGSVQTTGYVGGVTLNSSANSLASFTTAFLLSAVGAASYSFDGHCVLTRVSGNTWACSIVNSIGGGQTNNGGGSVTLTGVADRIRLTTVNGTDLFDSGLTTIFVE